MTDKYAYKPTEIYDNIYQAIQSASINVIQKKWGIYHNSSLEINILSWTDPSDPNLNYRKWISKKLIKDFYQTINHQQEIYSPQSLRKMDIEKQSQPKFAFMLDVSGSVGGSDNYWNTVKEIIAKYGQEIKHYYFWDSSIENAGKKNVETAINRKMGRGGTSPQLVAKEVIDKKLDKIILITDGQVSDHSVQQCDKHLKDHKFAKTICFIISTSSYASGVNLSVTCPFTRNCDNQVYQKPYNGPLQKLVSHTPEDYKILDTLDEITLDNFIENYEKIEALIIALNMGKDGNIPLKNQLVVMKKRLVQEISKRSAKKDVNQVLREQLESGRLEEAIEYSKKLTENYLKDNIAAELQKKIGHLINLCGDLRGKYDLNAIKSNKMAHAQTAEEAKLDQQVEMAELSNNPIQCPIILDEDVPQILIDECEPLLVGVDKAIVDDITTCPLRLLNYPDLKKKLKSRLSNFMGVKYADKFYKNPFTQNRLLGAIPLGCHHSHIKVGNHTIAKLISDGKILGNLNLFYAVIWHIIKEKEIEYLKEIEKNATQHLIFRLKSSKTMASLSGLSQLVSTRVNTDLAIWYCVNSCCFDQPLNRDTFRFHTYSMDALISLVQVLGYPYHKGVHAHLSRTKALLSTLSLFKKVPFELRKNFTEALRCLSQNAVEIKKANINPEILKTETFVSFIPIDGNASNQQTERIISLLPNELKRLPVEEIVALSKLIDAQKSAADISIPFHFDVNPINNGEVNWGYDTKMMKKEDLKICPQTFRPLSTYNGQKWESLAEKTYGLRTEELFKGRKYFQAFLYKFKKIPNKDELILFYYNRIVINGKKTTLPSTIESWAEELINQYKEVMSSHNLSVKEAIGRLSKSLDREARKELEKE